MEPRIGVRAALLFLVISYLPAASPSRADEIGLGYVAPGLTIHGPDEVLRRFCFRDAQGILWLTLPGGPRFELVTSPQDPAIANPGDGAFHPFEEAEVRAALDALSFPLESIRSDVFLLPFPRRSGLQSAAGPQLILLSPGVLPISRTQQHAEFVHELGHVVQYALMPDAESDLWDAYRRLRGIEDRSLYSDLSVHANRPHEIFAEDFRALFGGSLARYSGTIENPDLPHPAQVAGLDRFMLGLESGRPAVVTLAASPSPARGAVRFSLGAASAAPLDLHDVSGRRLATLQPVRVASGWEWFWDGRDASGHRPPPGVVYARLRGRAGAAARVIILP